MIEKGQSNNFDYDKLSRILLSCKNLELHDIEKKLKDENIRLDVTDDIGRTYLHCAIMHNSEDVVETLLKFSPKINFNKMFVYSPLIVALHKPPEEINLKIINMLLDSNKDVNPMAIALACKRFEILQCFINKDITINPNTPWISVDSESDKYSPIGSSKTYPIHIASLYGDERAVEWLIRKDADPRVEDDNGGTALHMATARHNLGALKLLLPHYPKIDIFLNNPPSYDSHPLHLVFNNKYYRNGSNLSDDPHNTNELIKALLEKKPNVDLEDKDRKAPWAYIFRSDIEVVKQVLSYRKDMHQPDSNLNSPFFYAIEAKNISAIDFLLANEAGISKKCIQGKTPLICALDNANFTLVQYLVEKGADIQETADQVSPLMYALDKNCNVEIIKYLITKGANLHFNKDGNATTALHQISSWKGLYPDQIIDMIFEREHDILTNDLTSFQLALYSDNVPVIKSLINHLDISKLGTYTELSTFIALKLVAKLETLQYSMQHGFVINVNNQIKWSHFAHTNQNFTYLHYVCLEGELEAAKFLIKLGANVNARDNVGETPLHYAAKNPKGREERIRMLFSHGAFVNSEDNEGRTPLDLVGEVTPSQSLRDAAKVLDLVSRTSSDINNLLELAKKYNYNIVDKIHGNLVFQAIHYKRYSLARELLKCGVNPNSQNPKGEKIIERAKAHLRNSDNNNPISEELKKLVETLEEEEIKQKEQQLQKLINTELAKQRVELSEHFQQLFFDRGTKSNIQSEFSLLEFAVEQFSKIEKNTETIQDVKEKIVKLAMDRELNIEREMLRQSAQQTQYEQKLEALIDLTQSKINELKNDIDSRLTSQDSEVRKEIISLRDKLLSLEEDLEVLINEQRENKKIQDELHLLFEKDPSFRIFYSLMFHRLNALATGIYAADSKMVKGSTSWKDLTANVGFTVGGMLLVGIAAIFTGGLAAIAAPGVIRGTTYLGSKITEKARSGTKREQYDHAASKIMGGLSAMEKVNSVLAYKLTKYFNDQIIHSTPKGIQTITRAFIKRLAYALLKQKLGQASLKEEEAFLTLLCGEDAKGKSNKKIETYFQEFEWSERRDHPYHILNGQLNTKYPSNDSLTWYTDGLFDRSGVCYQDEGKTNYFGLSTGNEIDDLKNKACSKAWKYGYISFDTKTEAEEYMRNFGALPHQNNSSHKLKWKEHIVKMGPPVYSKKVETMALPKDTADPVQKPQVPPSKKSNVRTDDKRGNENANDSPLSKSHATELFNHKKEIENLRKEVNRLNEERNILPDDDRTKLHRLEQENQSLKEQIAFLLFSYNELNEKFSILMSSSDSPKVRRKPIKQDITTIKKIGLLSEFSQEIVHDQLYRKQTLLLNADDKIPSSESGEVKIIFSNLNLATEFGGLMDKDIVEEVNNNNDGSSLHGITLTATEYCEIMGDSAAFEELSKMMSNS